MTTHESGAARGLESGVFDEERLRLPDPSRIFAGRAARLRILADERPSLAGFLSLIADLADAQHRFCHCACAAWDAGSAAIPQEIGSILGADAKFDWRMALRDLAQCVSPVNYQISVMQNRIGDATDDQIEKWAEDLLGTGLNSEDVGLAPFVAAALQTELVSKAAQSDPRQVAGRESLFHCPVCGSQPVAGVLQSSGAVAGLRFLHCALCSTEWRRVRVACVNCGSGRSMSYFTLEGPGDGIKAEVCGECKTYLKLIDRDKDPALDPFADDLASLGLDVLMAEEGFQRSGLNPFLVMSG